MSPSLAYEPIRCQLIMVYRIIRYDEPVCIAVVLGGDTYIQPPDSAFSIKNAPGPRSVSVPATSTPGESATRTSPIQLRCVAKRSVLLVRDPSHRDRRLIWDRSRCGTLCPLCLFYPPAQRQNLNNEFSCRKFRTLEPTLLIRICHAHRIQISKPLTYNDLEYPNLCGIGVTGDVHYPPGYRSWVVLKYILSGSSKSRGDTHQQNAYFFYGRHSHA
jgi:hypothetical protein